MRRLAIFFGLTRSQRGTFLRALATLPMVAMGLRVAGLRRIQALLADSAPCAQGEAEDIARLVMAAARHGPYRASCLPTALTLQWLLARHGIDSDLRLGVRKAGERIEAHAWLERGGKPLNACADCASDFTSFDAVIAPPAKASR